MIALLLRGALRSAARALPIAGALAGLVVTGALARDDDAIAGLPGGVLLPLAAAAAHRAASGDTRRAVDALVDRGLPPLRAFFTHWAVAFVLVCATLVVGGSLFLALAHHAGDRPLGTEIALAVPVLFAAALAYTSFYAAAGSFFRGHGLTLGVVLDLVFGQAGGLGWVVPQSHLCALLGARHALSPFSHFVWLYALAAGYAALGVLRTRHAAPAPV